MQRPLTGFAWALAVVLVISVIGGFCTDGFSDFGDTPVEGMVRVLPFDLIFGPVLLFAIVWPQTILASWLVRRFQVARPIPFALFLAVAGVAVAICGDHRVNSLLGDLMAVALVFVPCCTLWCISFQHDATG